MKLTNKELYRANRDAGERGQGEYPPKFGRDVTEGKDPEYKYEVGSGTIFRTTPKKVTKKAILKNSKRARRMTV